MIQQAIPYIYLISSICFILSLKGLSSPKSARQGNLLGIIGMILALGATFMTNDFNGKIITFIAIGSGGVVGTIIALRIKMTAMPQLVAAFHSLVGLAAVFVAFAVLLAPEGYNIGIEGALPLANRIEMAIGAAIGAITFTGSIIAFAKLQGIMSGKPIKFLGQKYANIALTILILASIGMFVLNESKFLFLVIVLFSLLIGVLLIIPIGGADMPVVVSMLNSYSGWAASGIGFTLGNSLLIITGALVGASGAILSYIMCRAMNRSIFNVIFGAFAEVTAEDLKEAVEDDRNVNISSSEDAAYMMSNSESVIIVPGYGMAVAQAQHAIKELTDKLEAAGVKIRFAIHPVAGRMPGHMNVLLAEANIDYEKVLELDEINRDFAATDVVLVVGANDVTNPAAKTDKSSPIYGMPVLNVEDARTVFFVKRSMSAGYAGVQNELFYRDNTMMLFGDAKKVAEDIVKALEGGGH